MKKRIISLLILVALLLQVMPVAGFAAEQEDSPTHGTLYSGVQFNPLYNFDHSGFQHSPKHTSDSIPANADFLTTTSEAAAALRSTMVNRDDSIVIYYESAQEPTEDLLYSIWDLALAETGNGIEGDYLRWVFQYYAFYASYQISASGTYQSAITYEIAYYTTAEQEAQLTAAVDEAIASFGFSSATSAYTKISTIYQYICGNITYDYANLNDDSHLLKYTAYAAMVNKTAVCQGYAVLLYRMLLQVGVSNRVVVGTSLGGNHAWNIATIDGLYYDLDSTWDANYGSNIDAYEYFLKCEANFPDHDRDPSYNTASFHSAYPMASSDYVAVESNYVDGDFSFLLEGDTAKLVKYTGSAAHVTIPATTNGVPVTVIGNKAFELNETLVSVTIPASVQEIEDGGITMVDYQYVSSGAFAHCPNLTTVNIPSNSQLSYIGECAFMECENLSSITLPNSLRTMALSCFENCRGLTALTIPEGVTEVLQNAVSGTGIKTLHIPSTCTYFHEFNTCFNLESITVAEGNPNYRSHQGVLYNAYYDEHGEHWILMLYPIAKPTATYTIAGFSDYINGEAFFSVTPALETLYIGNANSAPGVGSGHSMSRIRCRIVPDSTNPYYTTYGDMLLTKDEMTLVQLPSSFTGTVTIPDGITNISDYACELGNYTKLIIPDSVTMIMSAAFWQTLTLEEVDMPASLSYLGDSVFQECSSLRSIVIPHGVTTLGTNTLTFCSSLQAVELPATLTTIAWQGIASSWPTDIYFTGTEAQWNSISIDEIGNECLYGYSTIHFESHLSGDFTPEKDDETEEVFGIWEIIDGNWYYLAEDGYATGWITVDGSRYYMDETGVMQTGWLLYEGRWYYLYDWGGMGTGWVNDGYNWYYMNTAGIMQTGWLLDGGKWYYLDSDGHMVSDTWRKDSIGWCYLGSDGAMLTNCWAIDSAGWCYIGPDGYCETNCWKQDSYGWLYLNSEGSMTKSTWILTDGHWYYLDANGYRVTNAWRRDSIGWCYLGNDGAMLTNCWLQDSVGWCYIGPDGYCETDCWKQDSYGWLYLDSEGSMTKSQWLEDGGCWYYLDDEGYMVTGEQEIDGTWYVFNDSGVWIA